MPLVVMASAKGSPGTTTAALAMTAAWSRPALLAELDATGSDLLYRLRGERGERLPTGAGVAGLLAAADRGDEVDPLHHATRVAAGFDVLLGPRPADAGSAAGRWGEVAGRLAALGDTLVVADCGRLCPGDGSRALLTAADAVVLVTHPTIDGVAHLLARADDALQIVPETVPVGVVVVTGAQDTKSLREIWSLTERAGVEVSLLGRLAHDPDAVGLLGGEWTRRLETSLLIRSARDLTKRLDRLLEESSPEATGT
jgi:MinD-like ATPase involved in chromosome partitioning or flagellar assembly